MKEAGQEICEWSIKHIEEEAEEGEISLKSGRTNVPDANETDLKWMGRLLNGSQRSLQQNERGLG